MRLTSAALAALLLAACLPRPRPTPEVQQYDFGPPAAGTGATALVRFPARLLVRPPDAPLWMDSPSINYRLAYDQPARIRSYAYSRWVSSPTRLLGDLLRRRVAEATGSEAASEEEGAGSGYVLQLQVEEFSQVFDSKDASHGVVRARATLIEHSGRQLVAQKTFALERPAPSPDAPGAVQALGDASRQLADQVVAWIAASAPQLERPAEPTTGQRPGRPAKPAPAPR